MLALVRESSLHVNGALPGGPAVGVVGARGATRVGLERAAELGQALARGGFAVVSGGARGIDAAAHRGALRGGGATVAVLGTGLDVVYPPEHGELFAAIVRGGGALVTPFAAGAPPAGWRFRARNQVIAALSQVLVVVEAEALSGSLSTARAARKLGRPVLALPGSAGCDRLLETGAASLCEDAGDVVKALGGERRRAAAALPAGADVVLAALTARAERADAVAARAGLAPGQVLAMLAELELSGHALRDASGRWLRSQVEVA